MLREYNSDCPAHDGTKVGLVLFDPTTLTYCHCEHCRANKGTFLNGIDCAYSKEPVGTPKFHVGQVVYRNGFIKGEQMTVVLTHWDDYGWDYILRSSFSTARERHYTHESDLFNTKEEAERSAIQESAKQLLSQIKAYEKRFGKTLSGLEIKLLGD